MVYPQHHSLLNRLNLQTLLPFCTRQASRIIADSQNTRTDIIRYLDSELESKIVVIYPGIDPVFLNAIETGTARQLLVESGVDVNRPYILSVGTLEPRKFQSGLVEVFGNILKNWPGTGPRPQLVLAGKIGWGGEYSRVQAV